MTSTVVISGAPVEGDVLTASIETDSGGSGGSSADEIFSLPTPRSRFFTGYQWRFLFTDLDCVTTTFAEGIVSQRTVVLGLGAAETITGSVVPDDPRINTIWDDGYPKVAPLKRIVWAFRRDGAYVPWQPRAAGILLQPSDHADNTVPVSEFTAYGPRTILAARPVLIATGSGFTLPSENAAGGVWFLDPASHDYMTGDQIALTVLYNSIQSDGPCFIDAGPDYGGTAYWGGTIETTDPIPINAQSGAMVADIWKQLEDAGNCDIVLTPVYDPVNRPGITHDLSIFRLAGDERPDAVFGWDRLNRACAQIERMHDATPGNFFNRVQYFAGQGGFPIPADGPLDNAESVDAFGVYWATQFFPSMQQINPTGAAVLAVAEQALELVKQGKRTMTITPIPERAPVPITDYTVGDRVPIYASDRLRITADGYQRVQTIPVEIDDNGVEHVNGFVASPDFRTVGS